VPAGTSDKNERRYVNYSERRSVVVGRDLDRPAVARRYFPRIKSGTAL
jgi:hypothetical protein